MKQHTEIVIHAPIESLRDALINFASYPQWNPLVGRLNGDIHTGGQIQLFIKPLKRGFTATLELVESNRKLSWVGTQIASWFISGEHYYRLEAFDNGSTRSLYGENFRGFKSAFISGSFRARMVEAFKTHIFALKERLEK